MCLKTEMDSQKVNIEIKFIEINKLISLNRPR